MQNSHLDWEWKYLSCNKKINIDFILDNPSDNWDMDHFFDYNRSITWKDIEKHKELPWNFTHICYNVPVTLDVVKKNPQYKWNWHAISSNDGITFDDYKNNPQFDWSIEGLSMNKNLRWKHISDNMHLDWEWWWISYNQDIDFEIVMSNPEIPWRWINLSNNSMEIAKERWIKKERNRIIKANIIKRYYRNCSYSPYYQFGRKMIIKRFESN